MLKRKKPLGRPQTLKVNLLIEKCLENYWKYGITNLSLNDLSKLLKVSKGSIYKYFKDIDNLHCVTLEYYNKKYIVKWCKEIEGTDDLFKPIDSLSKNIVSDFNKPCFFNVSRLNRYLLGEKTRKKIDSIDHNITNSWKKAIRNHVKKNEIKKNFNTQELSEFILHFISYLNLMKLNKFTSKHIANHTKILKEKVLSDLLY
tara:strand:+ start:643 stop:1245 length:603 start_codon:yes stop_codon:yes gene_type:complete